MTPSDALAAMKADAERANARYRALGFTYAERGNTVPDEVRERAATRRAEVDRLYREGWKLPRIAEHLGCALNTVKSDLSYLRAKEDVGS